MRLFVAVMLEDGLVKEITGTMHELKKAGVKGNYTPARNLHMTLAFLGEVKDVASVKEAMKQVAADRGVSKREIYQALLEEK